MQNLLYNKHALWAFLFSSFIHSGRLSFLPSSSIESQILKLHFHSFLPLPSSFFSSSLLSSEILRAIMVLSFITLLALACEFSVAIAAPPHAKVDPPNILWDGRIPPHANLTDFDSYSTSRYGAEFVLGTGQKWSEVLKLPKVMGSRVSSCARLESVSLTHLTQMGTDIGELICYSMTYSGILDPSKSQLSLSCQIILLGMSIRELTNHPF